MGVPGFRPSTVFPSATRFKRLAPVLASLHWLIRPDRQRETRGNENSQISKSLQIKKSGLVGPRGFDTGLATLLGPDLRRQARLRFGWSAAWNLAGCREQAEGART
jgi:hypothetical protein